MPFLMTVHNQLKWKQNNENKYKWGYINVFEKNNSAMNVLIEHYFTFISQGSACPGFFWVPDVFSRDENSRQKSWKYHLAMFLKAF
jgi:hypothetical protein